MIENRIKLVPITYESENIFKNLMTLYLHDLSEYTNDLKINDVGLFEYEGIEFYFKEEDLKPFFIYYEENIAGFVLLNSGKFTPKNAEFCIHEFFILKSYRKKGIGTEAINKLLEKYKGKYIVAQLAENKPAISFWHNYYTNNNINYIENERVIDDVQCITQIFEV